MRWMLLVACTACGRLGFDAAGPPIDLGGDAAIDAAGCTFGPWGTPQLVGISTTATEEAPALSPDGLDLYFHRYPTTSADIYVSHRTAKSEPFAVDQPLMLDTTGFDRDPVVTAGGHHLFFGSDRDTGMGADELWESIDLGAPTKISEVPPGIYGPWLREDELELWYNDGTLKLYVRTRAATTEPFGPPTLIESLPSVGYPSLSRDGREIYVEGNSSGVAKIYVATRTDPSQPVFDPPRELTELEGTFTRLGDPQLANSDTELYFDADVGSDENIYVSIRTCL